jgi:primosomal protein N'
MFIVEVMPIKKRFGKESLSYFSPIAIERGSLVKAPMRNKQVWGIVVGSSTASMQKAELKNSSFAVKKISDKAAKPFFEEWWMRAVSRIAEYFAVNPGEVVSTLTPVPVLDNIDRLARVIPEKKKKKNSLKKNNDNDAGRPVKSEVLCIQTEDRERWGYYRSAIREEFAKKHSVFLCLPTHEDIKEATSQFEKGIEQYTFVFHAGITRSELIKKWNACLREEHPILIIATPQWLGVPRGDIGTIILDRENSSSWRTLSRPHIDLRKAVELIAKEKGARLLLGDSVLRVETIWRYKNDEIFAFEPVKFRLSSQAKSILLNLKGSNSSEQKGFTSISPLLAEIISEAHNSNKNTFIYCTRKGLASVTVCNDCGEEVLCHNCKSPVVLYKSSEAKNAVNIFRCHQCSSTRSAKEVCRKCGSWRLMPLGIGVERVVHEMKEKFPQVNIFQISRDACTPHKASQIAEKFYKSPGSVLVGTEMAFYYLKSPIDFTAIASIDSLFSVPDYKIREKIFHLVLRTKLLAREKCLVQTRGSEKGTIELALQGNVLDFYKAEIEDREALEYPPFSIFIKITVRGEKVETARESEFLEKYFEKWNPAVFNSVSERRAEPSAVNCVIKLPRDKWPALASDSARVETRLDGHQSELLQKIMSLPPYFEIKVDPDNLL